MPRLYIITLILLVLVSACKKENETADFYCKVNNERWVVYDGYNTGVSAEQDFDYRWEEPVLTFHIYAEKYDEGVLDDMAISIRKFNVNNMNDQNSMRVTGNAVNNYTTNYEIDTMQPSTFTVLRNGNDKIEGTFNFTLKRTSNANSENLPEYLVFTDGRIACKIYK